MLPGLAAYRRDAPGSARIGRQAAELARLLKAPADPTRLRLVSMVAAHKGGEACVCDLTAPLGLSATR